MTTAHWVGVIATFINVICAYIYVFAPRRHHHDWSAWSQWIVSQTGRYSQGVRYRHCRDCSKVQHQESGYHRCMQSAAYSPCQHLGHLNMSEIKRLERDLGL